MNHKIEKIMLSSKIVKQGEGKRINALNDKHLIKLIGEDTDYLFSLIEQTYKSGSGSPLHLHLTTSHLLYVTKGSFSIKIGELSDIITDGDIVFIPKQTPHEFKVVSPEEGKLLVFNLPSGLENLFLKLDKADEITQEDLLNKFGIKSL